jgi:vacuolar-type H+-ATPase subunit F/Vma7
MRIKSQEDLESIRGKSAITDEIVIEGWRADLKYLIVYCIRYAAHSLKPNGKLKIELYKPGTQVDFTYSATTNRIALWQLQRLIYRFQTDYFEVLSMSKDSSEYIFRRIENSIEENRELISVVIVSGGTDEEYPHLENSIRAAVNAVDTKNGDEVVIATGEHYNDRYKSLFSSYPVRVISFPDDKDLFGRFLIGKKKNFAISNARNNNIVLIHARITISPASISILRGKKYDLCAPKVVYSNSVGSFSYLDAFVHCSVDLCRTANRSNLRSIWFGDKYFSVLENAYLIVDGGAWLINRAAVGNQLFDPNSAWGEAEDVEACRTLLERGRAVDFLPEIIFESQTTKIKWQKSASLSKLYRFFEKVVRFISPLRLVLWKNVK